MRSQPAVLAILALLTLGAGAAAGQPLAATPCELMQSPADFRNQIVTIRAGISIAFEEFALSLPSCPGRQIDRIWLEYGSGPRKQPTVWCCGDMIPRDPLVLVQDREFRKFDRRMRAQAKTASSRTTATITGRFDVVESGPCPGDVTARCPIEGGFGHLGAAAARLVIQRVADVVVSRN